MVRTCLRECKSQTCVAYTEPQYTVRDGYYTAVPITTCNPTFMKYCNESNIIGVLLDWGKKKSFNINESKEKNDIFKGPILKPNNLWH